VKLHLKFTLLVVGIIVIPFLSPAWCS